MDRTPRDADLAMLARFAQQAFDRCEQAAAACTETPGQITRTFCSAAIQQLHELLNQWTSSSGLPTHVDAAGNWWTRWTSPESPTTPALIIGSHLDTVPDGGKYDGLLGVMLGVALVEALAWAQVKLPFAVEVVGFSEEEGVRFAAPFIGSRALIGDCDEALLSRTDAQGVSVSAALEAFGCNPANIAAAAISPEQVLAYLEPHIEQGPVLQIQSTSLGVVSAIAGQTRATVQFRGEAGHAGTVPMSLRRDALTATSEWILAVDAIARQTFGLVATVGFIEALPGAGNVIPGEVNAKLDVRHADNAVRLAAVAQMLGIGQEIAARRNMFFALTVVHEHAAAAMDALLTETLARGLSAAGIRPVSLVSGAGHDAAVMARRFPTAMLFIRCRNGVSHHPDEAVTVDDVRAALVAMWHFVHELREQVSASQEPPR